MRSSPCATRAARCHTAHGLELATRGGPELPAAARGLFRPISPSRWRGRHAGATCSSTLARTAESSSALKSPSASSMLKRRGDLRAGEGGSAGALARADLRYAPPRQHQDGARPGAVSPTARRGGRRLVQTAAAELARRRRQPQLGRRMARGRPERGLDGTGGPRPLSEPETRVLANLAREWKPDLFVDVRSGDRYMAMP